MKKALMVSSVASMIDLFNMNNIQILKEKNVKVDVACNFIEGSITSSDRVSSFREELNQQEIDAYHVPIPRSIFKFRDMLRSYLLLKQLIKKNGYDLIHCHSPIGGALARIAAISVRKKKTKVMYTAHGFHFFKGSSIVSWLIFFPIEYFLSIFTDILITINREDYDRSLRFKSKKVVYIPGIGVNTYKYSNNIPLSKIRKLKDSFNFSDDDFIIMSVGQLSVRKNHELVIRALSYLPNSKIKYLLIGIGELEEQLKTLAKELKVNDRVVFAGFRSDISDLLKIINVFVFPSLQEGLPVSLMEAMASGKPVICTSIRGNTDLIEDNKGGFLIDLFDHRLLSEKIKVLYDQPKVRDSFSQRNLEFIKLFDEEIINQKMNEIYDEILN